MFYARTSSSSSGVVDAAAEVITIVFMLFLLRSRHTKRLQLSLMTIKWRRRRVCD